MRTLTFMAFAAGLLLAGPVFAGDQDMTQDRLQIRDQLKDGTGDGTPDVVRAEDRLQLHTGSAEVVLTAEEAEAAGKMARERVQAETREGAGAGAPSEAGAVVRERARFHGCEEHGSEACKAHHAVRDALTERAGMPEEMPGRGEGLRAAERHAAAEEAALRHAERHEVRERAGVTNTARYGPGPGAGAGAGPTAGPGPNAGEPKVPPAPTRDGPVAPGPMGPGGRP